MNETLFVAVIQTSLDYEAAWSGRNGGDWRECVRMSLLEEQRAKKEIRHYLASLRGLDKHPDIVLIPELAVPIGFEKRLIRAAENLESIVIAGLDYGVEKAAVPTVSNEAIVVVPKKLKGTKIARHTATRRVGKTYPAPGEIRSLQAIKGGGVKFLPRPTVWLFESSDLGNFAVAICYDFMDLDRMVLYRNKIQTLFILAYNRDTTSFDHLAESIARTVFCNVVVCNCGFYGGSLAVSPFIEPFRRTVYRHSGQKLPNAQLIELPLSSLKAHQIGGASGGRNFKSLPPGFSTIVDLTMVKKPIGS